MSLWSSEICLTQLTVQTCPQCRLCSPGVSAMDSGRITPYRASLTCGTRAALSNVGALSFSRVSAHSQEVEHTGHATHSIDHSHTVPIQDPETTSTGKQLWPLKYGTSPCLLNTFICTGISILKWKILGVSVYPKQFC